MYISVGSQCMPKMTFTSVSLNPTNIRKYIKVAWCLYPSVPEKMEMLYVQIRSKNDTAKMYFQILIHKSCRCRDFRNSPAGYEDLRKANIREINETSNGKLLSLMKYNKCSIKGVCMLHI